MTRTLDSLRRRFVFFAVCVSGHAVSWYLLALLAGALLDWSCHV